MARDPRVVGLGLAAIRDTLSYAKHDETSLFPVEQGVGFGASQSGRFLRHFIYQGFNVDERGRKVFDGMLIHTAGAGRGSFNHRFAQPSRDAHRYSSFFYPTDLFPFTGREQRDPLSGAEDGLFESYKDAAELPKIMYTNTAYDYWGRAASAIHTTPDGTEDVELLPNERLYVLGGGQHYVGAWPPSARDRVPGSAAYRGNPLDFRPTLRALLAHLIEWVAQDREPPASAYPTIRGHTLVPPEALAFPVIPGLTRPGRPHALSHRLRPALECRHRRQGAARHRRALSRTRSPGRRDRQQRRRCADARAARAARDLHRLEPALRVDQSRRAHGLRRTVHSTAALAHRRDGGRRSAHPDHDALREPR